MKEIHLNLPHTQGQLLSTKTTDIKGSLPYAAELDGIKVNGEVFDEYYFKILGSAIQYVWVDSKSCMVMKNGSIGFRNLSG